MTDEAPPRTFGSSTDSSPPQAQGGCVSDAAAGHETEDPSPTMARRSNYAFERNARAKAKVEKREAKRQARLAAKASGRAEDVAGQPTTGQSDSGQGSGS